MPAVIPLRACEKTPVAVPPSESSFAVGVALVSHTVPRDVTAAPPLVEISAPSVAPPVVMAVAVGLITVGATWLARLPGSPLAWKSLWLELVLFVARTQ